MPRDTKGESHGRFLTRGYVQVILSHSYRAITLPALPILYSNLMRIIVNLCKVLECIMHSTNFTYFFHVFVSYQMKPLNMYFTGYLILFFFFSKFQGFTLILSVLTLILSYFSHHVQESSVEMDNGHVALFADSVFFNSRGQL